MYPTTFIYHQQWRRVEVEELAIFVANTHDIIAPNSPSYSYFDCCLYSCSSLYSLYSLYTLYTLYKLYTLYPPYTLCTLYTPYTPYTHTQTHTHTICLLYPLHRLYFPLRLDNESQSPCLSRGWVIGCYGSQLWLNWNEHHFLFTNEHSRWFPLNRSSWRMHFNCRFNYHLKITRWKLIYEGVRLKLDQRSSVISHGIQSRPGLIETVHVTRYITWHTSFSVPPPLPPPIESWVEGKFSIETWDSNGYPIQGKYCFQALFKLDSVEYVICDSCLIC